MFDPFLAAYSNFLSLDLPGYLNVRAQQKFPRIHLMFQVKKFIQCNPESLLTSYSPALKELLPGASLTSYVIPKICCTRRARFDSVNKQIIHRGKLHSLEIENSNMIAEKKREITALSFLDKHTNRQLFTPLSISIPSR